MTEVNIQSKSEPVEELSYAQQLEQKLDELIQWSIANQPHKITKLSPDDFNEPRSLFCTIAKGGGTLLEQEPEPADGGAQYINDNPAPWP
ncbi:MAG: hypothetical protein ABW044_12540 [Cellvibrio sp.]